MLFHYFPVAFSCLCFFSNIKLVFVGLVIDVDRISVITVNGFEGHSSVEMGWGGG